MNKLPRKELHLRLWVNTEPKRPHKHEDLIFWFQGPIQGGYQKSCFVGSLRLYCTVLYCTVLYCTVLYCTVPYRTVLYCTVLHYTTLHYTLLYSTLLYYTILYYTILYYTILYYTILEYILYTIQYKYTIYYTILPANILYYSIYHIRILMWSVGALVKRGTSARCTPSDFRQVQPLLTASASRDRVRAR